MRVANAPRVPMIFSKTKSLTRCAAARGLAGLGEHARGAQQLAGQRIDQLALDGEPRALGRD